VRTDGGNEIAESVVPGAECRVPDQTVFMRWRIQRGRNRLRIVPVLGAAGLALLQPVVGAAQAWEPLKAATTASFRGLSVVDDRVAWASGTRGTVIRTIDGGDSWVVDSIPGAGTLDLRGIHARSGTVAHVAATAGRIWRTTDGGRRWSLRYQAADTSVFLDAIVFRDDRNGIALGDPIGGRFLILVTADGGDTWSEAPVASRPEAVDGEAAFAASGTSIALDGRHAWLGTGGSVARIHRSTDMGRSWMAHASSIPARPSAGGVFSVASADTLHGVAVGGDYERADSAAGTASFTTDGGRTWLPPVNTPGGYRSGVAIRRVGDERLAIAVGTTGSDFSRDGGRTWIPLDATPFNSVQFAPAGVAFAVGGRGRVARLDHRRLPR